MKIDSSDISIISRLFLWGIIAAPLVLFAFTIGDFICTVTSALHVPYPN